MSKRTFVGNPNSILITGNVDAQPTPLSESQHRILWSLQITITLTEDALLIFLQSRVEKLLAWAAGDLSVSFL